VSTCRDCIDFLCDYLDNSLPESQRVEFESHLAVCPCCRTFMETYRKTVEMTGGCQECDKKTYPKLPEDLIRAILSARNGAAKPVGDAAGPGGAAGQPLE